jgi:choline dehydrogenase
MMMYVRGNRGDYDRWRSLGNHGWGYDDVLPYFRRSEANAIFDDDYHGPDGPMSVVTTAHSHPLCEYFLEAAESLGVPRNADFNGAAQEGCGYFQATVRDGRRCGAKEAFIDPVRHRPNLTLLPDALVLRLVVDRGRACGIEYLAAGRIEHAEADVEVIVSAGAIGSPHLLMLSGLGPAAHLAEHGIAVVADLPGVGQDLQDHMGGCPVNATLKNPERFGTPARDFAGEVAEFEATGRGLLATHHLDAGAFLRLDPADPDPDFEALFTPGVAEFYRTDGVPERTRFHLGGFLLRPRSRGTVALASANPLDRPLIDPNYYADPADLALAVISARRRMEILDAKPFDDVRLGHAQPGAVSDAEIELLIRRNASTTWHPTSTCRMGTDDRAVVDPQLRVRGIEGLRICDASVMPTMTSGNTNAPVVMIAEKAADLIRRSAAA